MEHILNVLGYYRRLSNTDFNGPCLKSEEKFRYKRTLSSDTKVIQYIVPIQSKYALHMRIQCFKSKYSLQNV